MTRGQSILTITISALLVFTGSSSALLNDPGAGDMPLDDEALVELRDWSPEDHLSSVGQQIMANPMSAQSIARGLGERVLMDPLSLESALVIAIENDGIIVPRPPVQEEKVTLVEAIESAWEQAGEPMSDDSKVRLEQKAAQLDPVVEHALADLVHAMNVAIDVRGDPFEALTDEDLHRLALRQDPSKDYQADPEQAVALLGDGSPTDLDEIQDILTRIDREAILQFQWILAAATDRAVAQLQLLDPGVSPASSGEVFSEETPYGPVRVSDSGDDVHTEESFLHVDLGGDDAYRNRAGSASADILGLAGISVPPMPGSTAFDEWVEDTRERIQSSHDASIEIDLDGDDTYSFSGSGAQGYGGFGGFGALIDLGGTDSFSARTFAQGAGNVAGAGFLVSVQGEDRFMVDHQGQGFGQDAGGGFLLAGTGDNEYTARTRAQGTGWAVNLAAVLVDVSGNDRYRCTGVLDFSDSILPVDLARPGSICQATGWGGSGIIVDALGNDDYYTISSFQAMTLIGVSILVDLAGNDEYQSGEWSDGVGVLGAAVLFDGAGDDVYTSDQVEGPWVDTYITSVGAGYLGVGVLIDADGNDRYTSIADKGLWLVQYGCGQACSHGGGSGVLVDGGGEDVYRSEVGQGGAFIGQALLVSGAGDDTFIMDHNSRRAQGYAEKRAPVAGFDAGDCDYGFLINIDGQNSYSNPTTDFGVRDVDTHWGQGDYGRGMDGFDGITGYLGGEFQQDVEALVNDSGCTYAMDLVLFVLCESFGVCP